MMPTNPSKTFLGVGWNFPPKITGGQTALAQYEEDVRQSVLIILQTNPGERIMRPDFGAGLHDFVFEPVNSTTLSAISQRVEDSLIDWEPRIDVDSVVVAPNESSANMVEVSIAYRIRSTNTVGNLVYPFFLGEGTAK